MNRIKLIISRMTERVYADAAWTGGYWAGAHGAETAPTPPRNISPNYHPAWTQGWHIGRRHSEHADD